MLFASHFILNRLLFVHLLNLTSLFPSLDLLYLHALLTLLYISCAYSRRGTYSIVQK